RRMAFLALTAVILGAAAARASDPVGIYALIDKVVREPKEGTPERVQVWGVFVLARNYGNEHTAPIRGYMYFTTTAGESGDSPPGRGDLRRGAGRQQVGGFGSSRGATRAACQPTPE